MSFIREMMNRLDEIETGVNAEELADRAFNEAIRYIQDELGQKSGHFAGLFFSGPEGDTMREILTQYVQEEMAAMKKGRSANNT